MRWVRGQRERKLMEAGVGRIAGGGEMRAGGIEAKEAGGLGGMNVMCIVYASFGLRFSD